MAPIPTPSAESTDFPPVLIVPGLGNSAPDHWQSRWERSLPGSVRVDLGQWDRPDPALWVARLDAAIQAAARPVLLVAHSLGCHATALWARQRKPGFGNLVAGALLVAPPELDQGSVDPRLLPFAPATRDILPFPSVLVSSRNDPFIDHARARRLAFFWGCDFADAGAVGHINAASGLGDWAFGQFLLRRLAAPLTADRPPFPLPPVHPGLTGRPLSLLN